MSIGKITRLHVTKNEGVEEKVRWGSLWSQESKDISGRGGERVSKKTKQVMQL